MSHFVQYHNSALMGRYRGSRSGFGIVTNKPIEPLPGDTVWLITGIGDPRRYSLCSWSVVENTKGAAGGNFRKQVIGSKGYDFEPFVPIDQMTWFSELLKKSGNFSLGLHRIKSKKIIEGLQQVLLS